MDNAKTMVTFRLYENGDVYALFPEVPFDDPWSKNQILGYAHVGQHSAYHTDWLEDPLATPEQYTELLDELQVVYEGQLEVIVYCDQCQNRHGINSEAIGKATYGGFGKTVNACADCIEDIAYFNESTSFNEGW